MPAAVAIDARELARLWHAVLGRVQLQVGPHAFKTYLSGTRAVGLDAETLVVEARTAFGRDWLEQRLLPDLLDLAHEISGHIRAIRFTLAATHAHASELLAAMPAIPGPGAAPAISRLLGTLNASFTFERYLATHGNGMALGACRDLSEGHDGAPRQMVIYGPPGVGKTHLVQALAHDMAARGRAVACLNAEAFTTSFQRALKLGSMPEFQATYRGVELLIIDDLQYLSGKVGTQGELVLTMDAVLHAGGSVLCASETNPLDLDLLDRLRSRLSAGLVATISPFRREERQVYLNRAHGHGQPLPDWAIERIAGLELQSVRVLQGASHAAAALVRAGALELGRLDTELMRIAATEMAAARGETDREVMEAIARHFTVTFEDLVGRARTGEVSRARAAAAVALTGRGRSLADVARALGGRHRSTISESLGRGREVLAAEPELKRYLAG